MFSWTHKGSRSKIGWMCVILVLTRYRKTISMQATRIDEDRGCELLVWHFTII